MSKLLWVSLLLLLSAQAVFGDGARGNNLYFTVGDYLGNVVPQATLKVCRNSDMNYGCLQGVTDINGNVSFYIQEQYLYLTPNMSNVNAAGASIGSNPLQWVMDSFNSAGRLFNLWGLTASHQIISGVVPGTQTEPLQITVFFEANSSAGSEGGQVLMKVSGSKYADSRVKVIIGNAFGFTPQWTDFFPGCAAGVTNNPVRCACEIVLPNFHLKANGNLIVASIKSIFALDLINVIENMPTRPSQSFDKIVGWLQAVVTPLFMVLLITFISLLEIYLLGSTVFLAWSAAFDALFRMNFLNQRTYLPFIFLCFIGAIGLSIWLLGVDLNMWKMFITF